jgi:murein biosynthesis integral membrane protein MurJ
MTRPTMPPGPPYPEDDDPQDGNQPRFTPRQPGQSGPQPRPPAPPGPPSYQTGPGPYQSGPQPYQSGPQQPYQSGPQPYQPGPYPPPSGPQPPYEPLQHEPPTYQGLPPYDVPPPPPPAPAPHVAQAAAGYDPYPPPPPAPRPPTSRPSFSPHPPGGGGRQAPKHDGAVRGGKPRPSFTPREGYVPPPPASRARPAPMPTAFLPPVPAGYPQPSFQPLDFQDAQVAPRFVPADPTAPPPPPGAGDARTQVIDRVPGDVTPTGPQRAFDNTSPNLARSSKVMALGTVASRGSGFLRTLVLVIALGQATLADAYNNSNTLPNTVYYLMLGGIFTSVVVPMLVRAAKEDPDRGEGYAKRIYSLGVISLLSVTVLATALAGPIVDLYASNITDAGQRHVMVEFAYFFIPQIFFYGMDSLLGAILNVRGRFGANMWTPVINNVVVIFVALLYMATDHSTSADTVSGFGVNLLGIGTTLGIVIQSVSLFPIMWRAGFDMKLTFDFRRSEISEIGRMSGWMFGYVGAQWLSNLVAQRVANSAANSAAHLAHPVTGVGFSAYSYAYQLFQLPYAIVGISVISALLPRMSGHASDRRYSLVRDDFSKGVRIASVIVVPAAVFLGVLGAPLAEFLFAHGHTTANEARYIGEVFGAFSVGLVPFMFTQLQLRVFYSFRENRAPAILGIVMLVVGVVSSLVALQVLPPTRTVIGLAFAYDLVTLSGAILAWPMLLRRVGSLDGWRITRSLVRMFLATVPGLVFALVVMGVVGSFLHQGSGYGLVTVVIGGGGAVVLYALCARLLGIEEFNTLMKTVRGRFG